MSMMCCKDCGSPVDTDDNPESFYFQPPTGKEIDLGYVLCDGCKDDRYCQLENTQKCGEKS